MKRFFEKFFTRELFLKVGKYILIFHICYISFIAVFSLVYRFVNPPVSSLQIYRLIFNSYSTKKHYNISIGTVPKRYQRLLISAEDPNFYRHHGIDLEAMETAIKTNLRYGKKLSGASTITQQLARTLFLFPDKLYIRKYLEVIAALTMDAIIPKKRILELYLNNAEWGRGVYGIQSASYYYYGASLANISDDQVIRLLSLLPSPCKYSPQTFEKRKRLLNRYKELGETLEVLNSRS
ncbi:MAG TPA: transglycosylase domain-containing protein [Spirochaetota bacterium]|nr:transglycosylase domain-containing protein [Spirochaetota bacterium]